MSNVLLSFVGRNRYERCVYYETTMQRSSHVVRYIQEAICEVYCQEWSSEDKIIIFLTPNARYANWEGNAYKGDKDDARSLEEALLNLKLRPSIHVETIKEGIDEREMWQNFRTVFDAITEGDTVYLDITNAFRSIPLFATVLSNYAEFLKGVKIKSVFYGIFERLGSPAEVIKNYPNAADRRVPILDLKGLIDLQDWTSAANDFLKHGNATGLARMAKVTNQSKSSLIPPDFANNLEVLTGLFSTVRGKEIVKAEVFDKIRQNIKVIQEQQEGFEPLVPILEKVKEGLAPFKKEDIKNGFRAIEWCIEHQLVQQGITLFRETIVSYICYQCQMDYQRREHRNLVERTFQLYGRSKEELLKDVDYEKIRPIFDEPMVAKLRFLYQEVSFQYRNDINHGGYLKDSKEPFEFVIVLRRKYEELKKIIGL